MYIYMYSLFTHFLVQSFSLLLCGDTYAAAMMIMIMMTVWRDGGDGGDTGDGGRRWCIYKCFSRVMCVCVHTFNATAAFFCPSKKCGKPCFLTENRAGSVPYARKTELDIRVYLHVAVAAFYLAHMGKRARSMATPECVRARSHLGHTMTFVLSTSFQDSWRCFASRWVSLHSFFSIVSSIFGQII